MKTGTSLVVEITKVVCGITCLLNIILHAYELFGAFMDVWLYMFAGCPETLVLNMSKLVWSELTSVKQRDPLASEVTTLFLF